MANFTLDQTGQEIQDILDTVGNNQATSGQVLTADGNGGASWQNASGGTPSNMMTTDTEQTITGAKTFLGDSKIIFKPFSSTSANAAFLRIVGYNNAYKGQLLYYFNNGNIVYANNVNGNNNITLLGNKTGTLALTSDIDAKVPDAPSTDGTYTLKCVVSNGGTTKTYQWVLDN